MVVIKDSLSCKTVCSVLPFSFLLSSHNSWQKRLTKMNAMGTMSKIPYCWEIFCLWAPSKMCCAVKLLICIFLFQYLYRNWEQKYGPISDRDMIPTAFSWPRISPYRFSSSLKGVDCFLFPIYLTFHSYPKQWAQTKSCIWTDGSEIFAMKSGQIYRIFEFKSK